MDYTITLDPARQDLDTIHRALAGTYWSPGIRREVVAEALRNSFTALAIDESTGAMAGMARAVTDRATFVWLCDVFVLEQHRGRGLAKRMIQALEADPALQTVRRWCLITRDAHGLYEQLGFGPVAADRWMEKLSPTQRWQAAEAAVSGS
jgi:GNAT superfamily N-acetyltransferase